MVAQPVNDAFSKVTHLIVAHCTARLTARKDAQQEILGNENDRTYSTSPH